MNARLLSLTALATALIANAAAAQTAPDTAAPPPPPAAPAAPATWASTIQNSIHIEGGATFNPAGPDDGLNFGHLFTDKANEGLLNQVAVTSTRPLDPKATGVDIGYKLQGFYGSDARYTHFIGELDRDLDRRNQFDLVEANIMLHLPILTKGGMDIKAGQYSTPIGNEVIDPTGNFFYSHTYIFNFGIPLKHTGFYTTTHVSPVLDIYAGYDTGVNTSLGKKGGDDDRSVPLPRRLRAQPRQAHGAGADPYRAGKPQRLPRPGRERPQQEPLRERRGHHLQVQ